MPDFAAIYRHRAAEYDQLVAREDYQNNILRALQSVRPLDGVDVVDMGAGTGRLARLLAPRARTITAFDASPAMLRVAAGRLPAGQLAVGDNRRLPARDGVADVCLAGWTFGHLTGWHPESWPSEIDAAIAEMRRVLRPGGAAIILETLGTGRQTPQPPSEGLAAYYRRLEAHHGFARRWIRSDYRFGSPEEAERLTRFFFGDELADRVARDRLTIVPECTGVWSLAV